MERWLPFILTIVIIFIGIQRTNKTCPIYPAGSNQSGVLPQHQEIHHAILLI
ncbi:hypothetical protein [Candidatus Nitrosacidococcus sp. I8]|uniref:hypothetical protein n=1 Tax=Candidatus Nitrosacidococcus sp. I8 TaxID=2942908 RepID=UPI0022274434|nr:hypothetical protein [Candidatus Nitrosacidococcus sp. I8]CAH9019715.1 hypothetical protein NURINAE_01704 [Candidatus Nitrosacidococcus sp. I8]